MTLEIEQNEKKSSEQENNQISEIIIIILGSKRILFAIFVLFSFISSYFLFYFNSPLTVEESNLISLQEELQIKISEFILLSIEIKEKAISTLKNFDSKNKELISLDLRSHLEKIKIKKGKIFEFMETSKFSATDFKKVKKALDFLEIKMQYLSFDCFKNFDWSAQIPEMSFLKLNKIDLEFKELDLLSDKNPFTVYCDIFGTKMSGLVDSGAVATIIDIKYIPNTIEIKNVKDPELYGTNLGKISIIGFVNDFPVKINGKMYTIDSYVADEGFNFLTFGLNTIKKYPNLLIDAFNTIHDKKNNIFFRIFKYF